MLGCQKVLGVYNSMVHRRACLRHLAMHGPVRTPSRTEITDARRVPFNPSTVNETTITYTIITTTTRRFNYTGSRV